MSPASPRAQRRQHHQDLSRAHILDAAEEVFAQKGFHDATVKEIAARAEFSVGAVYAFFESKETLFAQIYLRRGAEFMTGMRAALDGAGTPRERLHHLADFQVRFFREHANFGRLYLRAAQTPLGALATAVEQSVRDNYDEAMALEAKLFREGQDLGELRDGDPEVLAMLFSGIIGAYQASDPLVVDDGAHGSERMPLTELHDVLAAAFSA
jgi:AcrR family transcriptional regulator